MSTLYDLVNVFDEQGVWIGEFINEDVAKHWLTKYAYDLNKCEISKRRPELKSKR